jgi:lipid II:glycine glycyltransferase (peptidoglycan interpeptide bridge formation enzyme)
MSDPGSSEPAISSQPATVAREPSADWDELAVDRPGGHVYQSRAWAEHRRGEGWRPLYVSIRGLRILALTRPWPLLPGASAYVPRGPAPVVAGDELGPALWAVTKALAGAGIDVVAVDPEVGADDAAWRTWLRRCGYHPIDEIQPSRHRMTLPLRDAAGDEDAVFGAVAKSTRQRIRKAEKQAIVVVRHDERVSPHSPQDGFVVPAEKPDVALDRFYDLLLETAQRKDFSFAARGVVSWWLRALAAGHLVYLEARDGEAAGELLAGLILYRHGGRLSTVHSADPIRARETHPGALHLLRWRAIQLAIREGCLEMDLGGVDVRGARGVPREDEPMHGLYQHKVSFGAQWLELAGAHERVIHRNRYRAGRIAARVARLLPVRGA